MCVRLVAFGMRMSQLLFWVCLLEAFWVGKGKVMGASVDTGARTPVCLVLVLRRWFEDVSMRLLCAVANLNSVCSRLLLMSNLKYINEHSWYKAKNYKNGKNHVKTERIKTSSNIQILLFLYVLWILDSVWFLVHF